jgi:RimJ/RimL family protein N-acetyltransferase
MTLRSKLSMITLLFAVQAGAEEPGRSATLVLCPREETCAEELMWLDAHPSLQGAPLQLAEAVLELDTGGWEGGEPLGALFEESLERARRDLERGHYESADGALRDAERALERWAGLVENQALVDLWLLRGQVRLHQQRDSSARACFSRAAALAWNRSVTLPSDDPALALAWHEAQRALVRQPTGRLRLSGSDRGLTLYLDGVPLGSPPLELELFEGTHRLTAAAADGRGSWKREVTIKPLQTSTALVRLSSGDDSGWITEHLEAAVQGEPAPTEVLDLLSDWAGRHGLQQLRIVMAEPGQGTRASDPVYELRQLVYDPRLRRLHPPQPR